MQKTKNIEDEKYLYLMDSHYGAERGSVMGIISVSSGELALLQGSFGSCDFYRHIASYLSNVDKLI